MDDSLLCWAAHLRHFVSGGLWTRGVVFRLQRGCRVSRRRHIPHHCGNLICRSAYINTPCGCICI